ncbi:hypothetical protein [Asanoa iriomotensis]|uniref:Uncharacterized protein n=1 Tax=Asanoa iriomotensis TaxID=234613 RepID=A0ABQ4CFF8_9ACTN|nr:hypothetical protein [Asanoa iriomotensis]GIF61503.1 hypothetical protein Air01nite_75980 [Asanoa iriomotensis]
MAGRRPLPIPDHRPAKLLAEKLRLLKGRDISYRAMGKVTHTDHRAFSTTANGSYQSWPSVEQFLGALAKVGRAVTEEDVRECRALHRIGHRNQQQRPRSTADALRPTAPTNATDPSDSSEGEGGVDVPIVSVEYPLRTTAVPPSLAHAVHVQDLVTSLVDLVMEKRLDLDAWRTRGADSQEAGRSGSPEWEVLTGRRPPTWAVVRRIVAQAGGGTVDLARWELVWRRVTGAEHAAEATASADTGDSPAPGRPDSVAGQTQNGEPPRDAWWHPRWFGRNRSTPGDARQSTAGATNRRGSHRATVAR